MKIYYLVHRELDVSIGPFIGFPNYFLMLMKENKVFWMVSDLPKKHLYSPDEAEVRGVANLL